MNRLLPIFFLLITSLALSQENVVAKKYADLIKAEELKDNLTILASDALEGRYTGSRGQKMAAAFIANFFQEAGLEPPVNGSYYQPFKLYSVKSADAYLMVGDSRYENYSDMFYRGEYESARVKTEIIFVGLGRDEDLAQIDMHGKAVLVLMDNLFFPADQKMRTSARKAIEHGAKYIFALPLSSPEEFTEASAWYLSIPADLTLEKPESAVGEPGYFYLKSTVVENIFSTSFTKLKEAAYASTAKRSLKKIKPAIVNFQTTWNHSIIRTENVLGYLPGSDKKNELVIVTAHYDHLGKRTSGESDLINNGADDDGSGTVAVMQLAKAFAEAKKDGTGPRRSMLFMTVAGEEEGLLGSRYYVTNPVIPLANSVVDLNIDMIGRTDENHRDNKNYLYVIGADKLSSELHQINESMNNTYTHVSFDYVYNDESHPDRLYYRSDHWNFATNNIPVIFFFDGIHEDYHQVTDEVNKIDFDLLALRTKCVFFTAWEIANREERLKVDKK